MRVNVYPRGANPSVDRHILRKSLAYAIEQVENFLAAWVDPADWSKGIIAREFLPSVKAMPLPESEGGRADLVPMAQLRFVPPPNAGTVMGLVKDKGSRFRWNWKPEEEAFLERMAAIPKPEAVAELV